MRDSVHVEEGMETFEFEAKNLEETIEEACRRLDRPRDALQIEILDPGSTGIFGLVGTRKARIRVTLPSEPEEAPAEEATGTEASVDQEQEAFTSLVLARTSLEQILRLIPIEGATVKAQQENGTISLTIEGDRTGILIGRKGRTLDALQFILNKIVNKNQERKARVLLDSEHYRERRKDYLVEMALKLGDKAKTTGKIVTTGLLNPHDRRIVHLSLKEDRDLDTKGTGEGILKKIVIIPRRGSAGRTLQER